MADKDIEDLTSVNTFLASGIGRGAVVVIAVALVVWAVVSAF